MPDLGPHAIFIWVAYGVTLVVIAALALSIFEDERSQRRTLADLERKGIRRRSAPAPTQAEPVVPESSVKRARKDSPNMTETARAPAMRRLGVALPLIIFAGLAVLFWYALFAGDPSNLPSALIGKKVPDFNLPPLEGLSSEGAEVKGFATPDLATGEPTIVNVFASWCGPCLQEHPLLVALASQPGVRLYGINYKDDPASARRFLGRHGNPFDRVGTDASGRTAIDFGVYGVPETYVISGDGKIAFRHVGPLTEQAVREKLLPFLKASRSTPQG